jgi:hypothetical protein
MVGGRTNCPEGDGQIVRKEITYRELTIKKITL